MQFIDIIGQEEIKKNLVDNVKNNRISHAQLFFGPEGSGKLALAIAYAQYICCTNRQENDSCGECPSCNKFQKIIHPDLHFFYPIASTKEFSKEPVCADFISYWREMILANPYLSLPVWYRKIGLENKHGMIYKREGYEIIKILNLKSFESEYKVLIIWFPEKMQDASAGVLLKNFEEPPDKTVFLLVAEKSEEIISTILSRVQKVQVNRIDYSSLKNHLIEKYNLEDGKASDLAKISEGNYMKALELLHDDEDYNTYYNLFVEWMRSTYAKNIVAINNWVEKLSSRGREFHMEFLKYSLRMIRENLILNLKQVEISNLSQKESDFSAKFSRFISSHRAQLLNEEINLASYHIERNGNAKIVLFDLSLRVITIFNQKDQ